MISDVSLCGRKCCTWGQLGSYIKHQASMQNSWHWVSTYTSLSPYQLNMMPFHWRRRVGNKSNISISLQLSHTCYLEYSTGQVQDWVNTSCTWLSMQEHQWNKRTHLLAAHFAHLFLCIIIVQLHSLVPRPHPAFCNLQYEKTGLGKAGQGLGMRLICTFILHLQHWDLHPLPPSVCTRCS